MEYRLMLERVEQKIRQKQTEVIQLEEALKMKKREVAELIFIRGGSDKGAEEQVNSLLNRAQKTKKTGKSRRGGSIVKWKGDEDQVILGFIDKAGTLTVGDAARQALAKLGSGRTDGAVRQRIMKLARLGYLRTKTSGHGTMTVERTKKEVQA